MKIPTRVVLTLVLLFSSATFLLADTLELRNGTVLHGHFISADRSFVRIRVGAEIRTIRTDQVNSIKFSYARVIPVEKESTPNADNEHSAAVSNAASTDAPSASAPTPAPDANPSAASAPQTITIPEGTHLTIRLLDSIDTDTNQVGDSFNATTDEPVIVNGQTVVPRNTTVHGRITQAQSSGKISGTPELQLQLTDLVLNGNTVPLTTGDYRQVGNSRSDRSAEMIGGSTALGALIGAIAGKGKGLAIGAASGAAAGTAVQVMSKGNQLKIPSETRLIFRLNQSAPIPLNTAGDDSN